MTTGDTAAYETTACNPGATANLIADQCAACILGQAGNSQPLTVEGTPTAQGTLTAQGPIAVNGGASVTGPVTTGSPITSTVLSPSGPPGFIGCNPGCGLTSVKDSSPAASNLSRAPVPQVNFPGVPAWGNCTSEHLTAGGSVQPECYSSLTLDCSTAPNGVCSYQMSGNYVFEGRFTIGSAAGDDISVDVGAGAVLLAFVPGSDTGGNLLIYADGSLQAGPMSGNRDVALYFDPADPSGTVGVEGGSLSVEGTIYAPEASVAVHGGPPGSGPGTITTTPSGADPNSGRLIVGSLDVGQYGAVTVVAAPPSPGYCWVYDDNVTVTTGAGTVSGQVVVESDCSGGSGVGIISINYGS